MNCGIIDIGSNSVRLMIANDNGFSDKIVITTKLAEGMIGNGILQDKAIQRTVAALSFLCEKAEKVDELFVFATAAVRNAKNKQQFIDEVYARCSVKIDVLSGEQECQVGFVGALNGGDGGIIDIGGASSEIAVVKNGKLVYSKSLYLGAVTLTDKCGQEQKFAENTIENTIKDYGIVPVSPFVAIGGTATSVAAILQELEPYNSKKVDGFKLEKSQLLSLKNKLFSLSVDGRKNLKGLSSARAEVIACGVGILYGIMNYVGVNEITISEKDNLEGYYKLKIENKVDK